MKVFLLNGSPHQHGCTDRALREVASALEQGGIETEIFWIGNQPIGGCIGCGACAKLGRCAFDGVVNEFAEKLGEAGGFVFGSPVHYAAASGSMTGFLDRLFMSGGAALKYKPAAAVVSARRAGTTAALDQLQKYMTFGNMLLVGSQYWTMVHGKTPEDVRRDEEGLQTMRVLARNMAWVLKCLEAGKAAGVPLPEGEERIYTSFIR